MEHAALITVRGYHLDGHGHVNNARYLEFLEEARWAWFGGAGYIDAVHEQGAHFVIARIDIRYKYPATVNDVLHISVDLQQIGHSSGTLYQRITNQQGTVVSEAEVTFVVVDASSKRPRPIEGSLRALLERQLAPRP